MVDGMKLLKYHVHDSTTRIYIYLCDVQSIQSDMVGDDERVTRLKLRPTRTEDPNPRHRSTTSFPPTTAVTVRVGLSFAIGLRKQGFQGFIELFAPAG